MIRLFSRPRAPLRPVQPVARESVAAEPKEALSEFNTDWDDLSGLQVLEVELSGDVAAAFGRHT